MEFVKGAIFMGLLITIGCMVVVFITKTDGSTVLIKEQDDLIKEQDQLIQEQADIITGYEVLLQSYGKDALECLDATQ